MTSDRRGIAALLLLALSVGAAGAQRTLLVPAQYPRIQAAINAASAGDTVLVSPGIYRENIFCVKRVSVRSANGPWVTTIVAAGPGPTAFLGGSPTFEGFRITGGTQSGIEMSNGAIVRRCVITGNTGYGCGGVGIGGSGGVVVEECLIAGNIAFTGGGGGVCMGDEPAIVRRNRIVANISHSYGGGIRGKNGTIENNEITANIAAIDGGGVSLGNTFQLQFAGNMITGNFAGGEGGGVSMFTASFAIEGCTFAGNTSLKTGGGIAARTSTQVSIANSILWKNSAVGLGDELYAAGATALKLDTCTLRNPQSSASAYADATSAILLGAGVNGLDPRFVDLAGLDCHLLPTSAAVDIARTLPGPTTDFEGDPRVFGPAADLGADEVHAHFYVTGDPRPGGVAVLRIIGPPGRSVVLGISLDARLQLPGAVIPGVGTIQLTAPILIQPLGKIPASGLLEWRIPLPNGMPTPLNVPLQCLIGTALSQVEVLAIR